MIPFSVGSAHYISENKTMSTRSLLILGLLGPVSIKASDLGHFLAAHTHAGIYGHAWSVCWGRERAVGKLSFYF